MSSRDEQYKLFIDESGDGHLNHKGKYFILSTILIGNNDFQIIEGYLRLLKRKFIGNDYKNIHTTDLAEKPYTKYRTILKPKNRLNAFLTELNSIVRTIPLKSGLYILDKNKLRKKLNYKPGAKKKSKTVNLTEPYRLATIEAIYDFANFLDVKKTTGVIVAESRFPYDGNLLSYFDEARTKNLPGGFINKTADIVRKRINSITISNKKVVDGGLELADMAAYSNYRKMEGDPMKRVKIPISQIITLCHNFRKKSYLEAKNKNRTRISIKEIT